MSLLDKIRSGENPKPKVKKPDEIDLSIFDSPEAFQEYERNLTPDDIILDESLLEDRDSFLETGDIMDRANLPQPQIRPKDMVIKLIQTAKLDETFTFEVGAHRGMPYIAAMRNCISRERMKMKKVGRPLANWMLLIVDIVTENKKDTVTLMRSYQRIANKEVDELEALLVKEAEDLERQGVKL